MSLIAKLKRRNVFRSALAYAVAGWLLVEVMDLITETFGAPDWVLQVFVSLVVIGIVPVVLFSWMYEITPEGIKREGEGGVDHSAATTQKLNIAIVIMLAIAIGLFAYQQFFGHRAPPATATSQNLTPQSSEAATPMPATGEFTDIVTESSRLPMVAVLPFTTVSLDDESDFFAVGVHDDLLTQLAKMESMRVISRTSVLEYKDTKKNIRDIGQELGADIIMEGGIQAAGGRIRINAQLIDADTDEHLWAETYDRELSTANIFDVQRDIANAIANALNTTLTVQDDEQLREIPTQNMAAYRAYHEALDIWDNRRRYDDWEALYTATLRKAIELDPDYIRPRAELVGIIALDAVGMVNTDQDIAAAAETELEAIRQLAPESAEYLIAQTYYIYYVLRDYPHAYEMVNRALARNPSDVQVWELKSWIERRLQSWDNRLETMQEIIRLDPREDDYKVALINQYSLMHRYDELVEALAETTVNHPWIDALRNLMAVREDGDFVRLLDATRKQYERTPEPLTVPLMDALNLNRRHDEAAALLSDFDPENMATRFFPPEAWAGLQTFWLLDDDEALRPYIQAAEAHLVRRQGDDGGIKEIQDYVLLAMVSAVKGDREAALRAVSDWEQVVVEDPAQLLDHGPLSCNILGMVAATERAVACLRRFLVEPSYALPFLNPYEPHFDAIREEPEFVALMADIEAGKYD